MGLQLPLVRFTALSVVIGITVFCGLHAWQVWRKRNRAASQQSAATGWEALVRRWAPTAVALGGLAMFLAAALREVFETQGVLTAVGVYTLRARDDWQLETLTETDAVARGDLLARFLNPPAQAEAEVLRVRLARLRAEKEALELQPLVLDPEIVRRHQESLYEVRQLESTYQFLVPAQTGLVRDLLQTSMTRKEQLARLDVAINSCRKEVDQAQVKLAHSRQQVMRDTGLVQKKVLSNQELEERVKDSRFGELEVQRLQQQLEDYTTEKDKFLQNLKTLDTLATEQTRMLEQSMKRTQSERERLGELRDHLQSELTQDRTRARQVRAKEVEQLALRLRETEATLQGLQGQLTIAAPFAGRIAYRHSAPNTTARRGALLVLSPEDGVRCQVRLAGADLNALRTAGNVELELVEPAAESSFFGQWQEPRRPTALAELVCQPPADTVQRLAEGEKVTVRLLWRPPLWNFTLFQFGLVLAALGTLAWCSPAWGPRWFPRHFPVNGTNLPAAAAPPESTRLAALDAALSQAIVAAPPHLDLEYGQIGRVLYNLGVRLAEAIRTDQLDPELLAAVEWALDRHHVRAVRLLNEGLGDAAALAPQVERLLVPLHRNGTGNGHSGSEHRAQALRLERILQVLDHRLLEPCPALN